MPRRSLKARLFQRCESILASSLRACSRLVAAAMLDGLKTVNSCLKVHLRACHRHMSCYIAQVLEGRCCRRKVLFSMIDDFLPPTHQHCAGAGGAQPRAAAGGGRGPGVDTPRGGLLRAAAHHERAGAAAQPRRLRHLRAHRAADADRAEQALGQVRKHMGAPFKFILPRLTFHSSVRLLTPNELEELPEECAVVGACWLAESDVGGYLTSMCDRVPRLR